MIITWLADELRSVGLTVIETPGWKSRGANVDRDGRIFKPRGIVEHHTAGNVNRSDHSEAHGLITGNERVPGPLAHLLIGRNRDSNGLHEVHVIASGKANHCGAGGWVNGLDLSVDMIGIEIHNNGIGEKYPHGQAKTVLIATDAILSRLGQPPSHVCSHHEWVRHARPGAKVDPRGPVELYPWGGDGTQPWDMHLFRDDLVAMTRPQEDEFDMTPEELRLHVTAAMSDYFKSTEGQKQLKRAADRAMRDVWTDDKTPSAAHATWRRVKKLAGE